MTPAKRHECMSHIHSKDTGPEMIVRRWLHAKGFRYRVNVKELPGTPDIVLRRYNTIIFVNGCFWHGHHNCKSYVMPKTRRDFWKNKIQNNIERDLSVRALLEAKGWKVIVIWACELKKSEKENTMERVSDQIKENRTEFLVEREIRKRKTKLWEASHKRKNDDE